MSEKCEYKKCSKRNYMPNKCFSEYISGSVETCDKYWAFKQGIAEGRRLERQDILNMSLEKFKKLRKKTNVDIEKYIHQERYEEDNADE